MKFSFTAVDKSGFKKKGVIDAGQEKEVIEYLRSSNLTPISVKPVEEINLSAMFSLNKVSEGDVVLFTRQLSSMILTGLTLIESLNILKEQANKPRMQVIIDDLIQNVSEGSSFSQALSRHKDIFSEVYIALIRAAETGGLLDKVLERLADNLEKSENLKKQIKSALFYPLIIMVGVVGVVVVMNIFVIPQLGSLYQSLNLELPWSTKLVLGISSFTTTFFPLVIMLVVGLILGYKKGSTTEVGRRTIDRLKLRLPVLGDITNLSILDEFTRTLSLLISSGASIIEGLNVTANISGNVWYKDAIRSSSELLEKGVTLSSALQQQNLFPLILIQMTKVGESTGKIDDSLLKVSEYFERDVNLKIKNLTTSIEPILLIVLGVIVGFLIISVITPIYSLISQIQ